MFDGYIMILMLCIYTVVGYLVLSYINRQSDINMNEKVDKSFI